MDNNTATPKRRKKHVPSELTKRFLMIRPKPKKPQNAFVRYSIDRRAMLMDVHGGAAKMKQLGEDWKNATSLERKKYVELAEPGRVAHAKAMAAWNAAFKQFKHEHTVKGAAKPFLLFRSEMNRKRKEEGFANIDGKEISALAKEEWAALSDDEKQVYVLAAEKDNERFHHEMALKKDVLIATRPTTMTTTAAVPVATTAAARSPVNVNINNRPSRDSQSRDRLGDRDSLVKRDVKQDVKRDPIYKKVMNSASFKDFVASQESHIRQSQRRPITEHELYTIAYKMLMREEARTKKTM